MKHIQIRVMFVGCQQVNLLYFKVKKFDFYCHDVSPGAYAFKSYSVDFNIDFILSLKEFAFN
jgi:hypothetical protein